LATFVTGAPAPHMSMDGGLRIHHEPGEARDALIVFIHGLGGSGYGTWGSIPSHVYGDPQRAADVGIFDYVSGKRRRLRVSPALNEVVRELLTQLEGLQYQRLVFVCHSMGGIIASTLLRRSHELSRAHGKPPVVQRASGVLALASPRAGARMIVFGGLKDARFLRAHNEVVCANEEFFTNQVNTHVDERGQVRFQIPVWAATATSDRYVDRFTATFGLPVDQISTFRGSHSSFLLGGDVASWVADNCQKALTLPQQSRARPTAVHTRFRGHPLHGDWHDSFHRAVRRFLAGRQDLTIYDASHEPADGLMTDLQIRVLPSEDCWMPETRAEIEQYQDEMNSGSLFALAVAPYGGGADEAARLMTTWVFDRSTWVHGIDRLDRLEDEIVRWLERTSQSLVLAGRLRVPPNLSVGP